MLTGRWLALGAEEWVSGVFVSIHLRLCSVLGFCLFVIGQGRVQALVSTTQRAGCHSDRACDLNSDEFIPAIRHHRIESESVSVGFQCIVWTYSTRAGRQNVGFQK